MKKNKFGSMIFAVVLIFLSTTGCTKGQILDTLGVGINPYTWGGWTSVAPAVQGQVSVTGYLFAPPVQPVEAFTPGATPNLSSPGENCLVYYKGITGQVVGVPAKVNYPTPGNQTLYIKYFRNGVWRNTPNWIPKYV